MGCFRSKAIETESRRELYSLVKGAHCADSVGPAGPLASGFLLLPFPQLGLCPRAPHDAFSRAALSSPFSCLSSFGTALYRRRVGLAAPAHVLGSFGPTLSSWVMRALPSGRARNKQPVHRQLHAVDVQEAREQWVLTTSSCAILCTEAFPPGTPQPDAQCCRLPHPPKSQDHWAPGGGLSLSELQSSASLCFIRAFLSSLMS